jgi:nucleotide-binding universal stress UspA family protein
MNVLLATDGSQMAENAAAFLARLPHKDPIHLTILAVHTQPDVHGSESVKKWVADFRSQSMERLQTACDKIASMFDGARATVTTRLMEGHAGKEIVHVAEEIKAHLVVVGAQGHSTVERLMLGSTSDFVATHAPCSVLVYRPGTTPDVAKRPRLKLCVAYDDSAPSKTAISQMGIFQWDHHVHLDIVSAMVMPYLFADIPIELDSDAIHSATLEIANRGAALAKHLAPDVQCHVIGANHVGDSLVDWAAKNHLDIMVLGDTGRGLLGRFLVGSVSRYVLRHAPCSVWIAREGL